MEGTVTQSTKQPDKQHIVLPKQLRDIPIASELPAVRHLWNINEDIASVLIAFEKHSDWLKRDLQIRPPSGSMLLYNRSKVRYRIDGYYWKKRKDGKTPREDHMKLKVQGLECIYGSYVHSAILPTFHRRCYWLLQNPDIVLVHYLNVPFPDNAKLSIPLVTCSMEKKEWTKEELVDQLRPMFFSGGSMDFGPESELVIEETIETIVKQLIDHQERSKSSGHKCDKSCDKNCTDSSCCKISPKCNFIERNGLTSLNQKRLMTLLQHSCQKISQTSNCCKATHTATKTSGSGGGVMSTASVVTSHPTILPADIGPHATGPLILNLINLQGSNRLMIRQNTTPIINTTFTTSPINTRPSVAADIQQQPAYHFVQTSIAVSENPRQIIQSTSAQQQPTVDLRPSINNIVPMQVVPTERSSTSNSANEKNKEILNKDDAACKIFNLSKSDMAPRYPHPDMLADPSVNLSHCDNLHSTISPIHSSDLNLDAFDILDFSELDKLVSDLPASATHDSGLGDSTSTLLPLMEGTSCLDNHQAAQNPLHDHHHHPHHVDNPQVVETTIRSSQSNAVVPPAHSVTSTPYLQPKLGNQNAVAQITDFSPEWGYPEGGAKVLVTGPWYSSTSTYSCLFDNDSVVATLVQTGVLRCFTPAHDPGLVTLQVACEGLVISDTLVFEYRAREKQETAMVQRDWFSLGENQLKLLFLERLEQLEKNLEPSPRVDNPDQNREKPCDFEERLVQHIHSLSRYEWVCSNTPLDPSIGGLSLLHLAAGLGYEKLIRALVQWRSEKSSMALEYEVDALSSDEASCTPFMWACAHGAFNASVTLYHWNNSTIKVCDKNGLLPLTVARLRGHHDLASHVQQLEHTRLNPPPTAASPMEAFPMPQTSTPIAARVPSVPYRSRGSLGNLHIDIPTSLSSPNDSKLVRRSSEQTIRPTSALLKFSKRFSVDILPTSAQSTLEPMAHDKPIRESNSEPQLITSELMTGVDNPMIADHGRDLTSPDVFMESAMTAEKMHDATFVSMTTEISHDNSSLVVHMDTDDVSSIRSSSPYIDVEEISSDDDKTAKATNPVNTLTFGDDGSEEAKKQMVLLAKQIIAAMPERIKLSPNRCDDTGDREESRERSSSHSSFNSQNSPQTSSFGDDSGISTPHGEGLSFDDYRYPDLGTPASSLSPDSTCLTSPYSPYNFQLDSPPPTTADFTEYFNAPATYMEKDFSQLTLSDHEQRKLYEAAKVIQSAYRQYRDKHQQQQRQKEIEAAILIQSYYRRYKQYAYFKKMTQAAVLIQSQFRSYYAQKRYKKSRDAAMVIQNQYRSYKEHERFKKNRNTSVITQQRFRSHYQRKQTEGQDASGQVIQLVTDSRESSPIDPNSTSSEDITAIETSKSKTLARNESIDAAQGETIGVQGVASVQTSDSRAGSKDRS